MERSDNVIELIRSVSWRNLRLAIPRLSQIVVSMSTVEEIESAIDRLSDTDVAELKAWLWDREIEQDSAAGRLDTLADEVLAEHRTGKSRPL